MGVIPALGILATAFEYPGYEESRDNMIVNYRKASIGDFRLNVDILDFQPGLSKDMVYNSL